MKVTIVRGLPGSGKSTSVKNAVCLLKPEDYVVCSADDYPGYYLNGVYTWTPKACKAAHEYCQRRFLDALKRRIPHVIVDNTNINKKAYAFYEKTAKDEQYEVEFLVIQPVREHLELYSKRNLHGVSLEIISRMFNQWEN